MVRWRLPGALAICASLAGRSLAQPVTNGQADVGDPAVIALVNASDQVNCTASVIGPHTAITAAHCVEGRDPRTLRVFVGSSLPGGGVFLSVSDARAHPGFDPGGRDLAVLTLREASPVAPLALADMLDASLVGTSFRVVGFGLTGPGLADAGVKREGTARIAAVQAEELVAVPDPSLSCLGDSGGPALLPAGTIAGVVSRGDSLCNDHAVYTRIDVARGVLVDPYLIDTAPGTASVGDPCFYEGHCADGPCLVTHDDPMLYFCSRPCERDADCPAAMTCAADGCRYPEPSPGALGSPCEADLECTSRICREQVCTRSCLGSSDACPADFDCVGSVPERYCFASAGGCGGCASGSGAPATLVLVIIVFAHARRRRRG
jgi:uncharacterized protein (TIGR03382 family)